MVFPQCQHRARTWECSYWRWRPESAVTCLLHWELPLRKGRKGQWGALPLTLTWRLFPGWTPTLLVSSQCQCPEKRHTLSAKVPAAWEVGQGVRTALGHKWHLSGRVQRSNATWLWEKTNSSHISWASLEKTSLGDRHVDQRDKTNPKRVHWSKITDLYIWTWWILLYVNYTSRKAHAYTDQKEWMNKRAQETPYSKFLSR